MRLFHNLPCLSNGHIWQAKSHSEAVSQDASGIRAKIEKPALWYNTNIGSENQGLGRRLTRLFLQLNSSSSYNSRKSLWRLGLSPFPSSHGGYTHKCISEKAILRGSAFEFLCSWPCQVSQHSDSPVWASLTSAVWNVFRFGVNVIIWWWQKQFQIWNNICWAFKTHHAVLGTSYAFLYGNHNNPIKWKLLLFLV